ncbi:DUF4083 family protein [Bacillus sp. RO3]|nr:DUF4083 family protein [Bacillus sp. RO3]
MYVGEVLFQLFFFSLLLLGGVSFFLFIRRLIINGKREVHTSNEINKKLDRIIELLESKN